MSKRKLGVEQINKFRKKCGEESYKLLVIYRIHSVREALSVLINSRKDYSVLEYRIKEGLFVPIAQHVAFGFYEKAKNNKEIKDSEIEKALVEIYDT